MKRISSNGRIAYFLSGKGPNPRRPREVSAEGWVVRVEGDGWWLSPRGRKARIAYENDGWVTKQIRRP